MSTITPAAAVPWSIYRYDIQRLMFGTSWLGAARIIRVSRRRQATRSAARTEDSLRRWAARRWGKLSADWHPVGEVEIRYRDDIADLFLRNEAAYLVDQRAIRMDDIFRRWLRANPTVAFETRADSIEIAVSEER